MTANASEKSRMHAEMFDVQFSYLYHRLSREPWWGMDYGLGNFTMLKHIGRHAPGILMDLDHHVWRGVLARCWDTLQQSKTPEAFVESARGLFGERWLAAYPVFGAELLDKRYFGCFRYDHDPKTGKVSLHFANLEEPRSPFENPEDRRDDLRRIAEDIRAKGLAVKSVGFESWMNNLEPALSLFPPSLKASLAEAEEFPKGYGWWGQFITKDGSINRRRAGVMKQEGRFELKRLNGAFPWEDFTAALGV